MAITCSKCGDKQGFIATFEMVDYGIYICPNCAKALNREKQHFEAEKAKKLEVLKQQAKTILVTTTPSVDGYSVKEYLGVESVEFVLGTGVFSEMTTEWQDLFGLRSTAFENKLQTAKNAAFYALKMLAAERGANAIIGIDLDYTEFSGNRIGLVLNGTFVRIAPINGALNGPSDR